MSKFKSFAFYFFTALVFIAIGWFGRIAWTLPKEVNPVSEIKTYPLEKYTIENLSAKYPGVKPSEIAIGRELPKSGKSPEGINFKSYEFTYSFDPTLSNGPSKTVSGLINIPEISGPTPLVIMIRGFIDQKNYVTGDGSRRPAEFFASKGYITIAPDFLGYGESSSESSDIFESRFQTYTTVLALLKSVEALKGKSLKVGSNYVTVDPAKIFIWAHSNGGQIALTALEVSGVKYPTVLWAPNSAKFPYSILYYLDEAEDAGKLIITKLADFMANYDVSKYAFANYEEKIQASIQINQGTADAAVPVIWNDNLVKKLKKLEKNVEYLKYPGADHNLNPTWNKTIEDNLKFFERSS